MKKKLENFIFRLRTTKLGIILIAIVIGTITLVVLSNIVYMSYSNAKPLGYSFVG